MLEAVVSSPLVPQVAGVIEKRLGRPLEPFDVWYNGFRDRGKYTEDELDAIVRKRFPTAEAYQADIPNLLVQLGFTKEKAQYLADHIVVDPARGSGPRRRRAARTGALRTASSGRHDTRDSHRRPRYGHKRRADVSFNYVTRRCCRRAEHRVPEALAFVFHEHAGALACHPTRRAGFADAQRLLGDLREEGALGTGGLDLDSPPDATPAISGATLRSAASLEQVLAPVFREGLC